MLRPAYDKFSGNGPEILGVRQWLSAAFLGMTDTEFTDATGGADGLPASPANAVGGDACVGLQGCHEVVQRAGSLMFLLSRTAESPCTGCLLTNGILMPLIGYDLTDH